MNKAQRTASSASLYSFNDPRLKALNQYSSQLLRELIIPKLTKEVNVSKRYAPLRQVYYSLILAQWFKALRQGLSPSPAFQAKKGTDPNKAQGTVLALINSHNLANLISKTTWSKDTYFKEYQKSFKDGEYNLKTPIYTPYGQSIRSYFSGGIGFTTIRPSVAVTVDSPVQEASYTAAFLANGNPQDLNVRLRPYTGAGNTSIHAALAVAREKIETGGENLSLAKIILEELLADLRLAQASGDITQLMDKWNERYPSSLEVDLLVRDIPDAINETSGLLASISTPSLTPQPIDKRSIAYIFPHNDYLAHMVRELSGYNVAWLEHYEEKTDDALHIHQEYTAQLEAEWGTMAAIWRPEDFSFSSDEVMRHYLQFIELIRKYIEPAERLIRALKNKENIDTHRRAIADAQNFIRGVEMLFDEASKEMNVNDSISLLLDFIFSNYYAQRNRLPIVNTEFSDDNPSVFAARDKIAYIFLSLFLPFIDRKDAVLNLKTESQRDKVLVRIETSAGFSLENVREIDSDHPTERGKSVDTGVGFQLAEGLVRELGGRFETLETQGKVTGLLISLPARNNTSSPINLVTPPSPTSNNPREKPKPDRGLGGIDLRALPITSQPIIKQPSLNSGAYIPRLSNLNLSEELTQIRKMINAGIIPSSQRIKECVWACSQKKAANRQKTNLISCLMDILRLQEEYLQPTDPILKESLVLLEFEVKH